MGLSRTQSKIQEAYSQLGIESISRVVDKVVFFCKGESYGPAAHKFYSMFLNQNPHLNCPEDVREYLRRAWWLEEEDLRQYCFLSLLEKYREYGKLYLKPTIQYLSFALFHYLNQEVKVFRDPEIMGNPEEVYELQLPQPDIRILFDKNPAINSTKLALYEKYLIYCFSLGYSVQSLSKLMNNQERRQTIKECSRLKGKLMGEKYYGS